MIIKVQHKNGTPLQSTVTRGELTAEMRDKLRIPAGNTVEDYADFNVWRNKRGEVRAVQPGAYSESKSRRIDEQTSKPTLIDVLKATLRHDGKAIKNINRAADKAGMSHAEARRLLDYYDMARRGLDGRAGDGLQRFLNNG